MAKGTKKPALWTVLYHTRHIMAVQTMRSDAPVMPFFTTPSGCEAWIMAMGFEQHFCSPPLWPAHLRELIEHSLDHGVEGYVMNPPTSTKIPVMVGDLEDLLEQVEARL